MAYIDNFDVLNKMPWLTKERKKHIISTAQCARELAELYAPELAYKAFVASLYHDCAKGIERDLIKKYNIGIFAEFMNTAHAPLGAMLARDVFYVNDPDIFEAIYWHCTGRADMTVLNKIVFLADAIEPLREYPNVQDIRCHAQASLDFGVYAYLNNLVSYLNASNSKINPYTLQFYNNFKPEV